MARLAAGSAMPSLAALMTAASAVLMRGLAANFAGKGARQVGHVFLPWATQRLKQPRQKLCWHGAYSRPWSSEIAAISLSKSLRLCL